MTSLTAVRDTSVKPLRIGPSTSNAHGLHSTPNQLHKGVFARSFLQKNWLGNNSRGFSAWIRACGFADKKMTDALLDLAAYASACYDEFDACDKKRTHNTDTSPLHTCTVRPKKKLK